MMRRTTTNSSRDSASTSVLGSPANEISTNHATSIMKVSVPHHFRRSDIQGLRGIAILLVVVYHSGLTFAGGFIGVDVFFVISGYVITSSILRQSNSSTPLNLKQFYLRRARRLLPGFLLVLVPVTVMSLLFFDPYTEFPEIRNSALSGLLLSANLYFLSVDSYDGLIDNPLRHLWSLGVEEHFYLAFPLIVYLNFRIPIRDSNQRLRRLTKLFCWILILSFTSSLFIHYFAATTVDLFGYANLRQYSFERARRLSFFFTPFRAWEILVGCILATQISLGNSIKPLLRDILTALGAIVLLASSFFLESPESFPGVTATIPVAATGILLILCPGTRIGQLLEYKLLTRLGDISYSLYLWHWPIMVIVKRTIEHEVLGSTISIALSLVLSIVSTTQFENPFRESTWKLKTVTPLLLLVPVLFGLGTVIQRSKEFRAHFPITESKSENFAAKHGCSTSPIGWEISCVFGNQVSKQDLYLFGDSNARSASDGMVELATNNGWRLTMSVLSACPTNFSEVQTSTQCAEVNAQRLALLRARPPEVVVIINHWTNYMNLGNYGSLDQQSKSLEVTLEILQSLGISSVIQYQIPICDFQNRLFPFRYYGGRITTSSTCEAPIEEIEFRHEMGGRLHQIAKQCRNVSCKVVNLTSVLCKESCTPFKNGVNVFSDRSHISPSASRSSIQLFEDAISEILEESQ